MRRFVILRHDLPANAARPSHWDLLFDVGDTGLKTWAVNASPDDAAEQPAERLADHRVFYLDFEGEIPPDRGRVTRWDAGTQQVLVESTDCVQFHLLGARLRGIATFSLAHGHWTYAFQTEVT